MDENLVPLPSRPAVGTHGAADGDDGVLVGVCGLGIPLRQALKAHDATFPDQTGKPIQNPTARWIFQYFVGIHVLLIPGQWPLVLNLTEEHEQLLRLLGDRYTWFYR
jgi:hypothetical protein